MQAAAPPPAKTLCVTAGWGPPRLFDALLARMNIDPASKSTNGVPIVLRPSAISTGKSSSAATPSTSPIKAACELSATAQPRAIKAPSSARAASVNELGGSASSSSASSDSAAPPALAMLGLAVAGASSTCFSSGRVVTGGSLRCPPGAGPRAEKADRRSASDPLSDASASASDVGAAAVTEVSAARLSPEPLPPPAPATAMSGDCGGSGRCPRD
mmetsp:Transcript_78270/g.211759  ORF Transcript_78270/g.211759 Transcript_78270/m.211759 type:complete len:215 (-) Transcript_78270:117-761(-)